MATGRVVSRRARHLVKLLPLGVIYDNLWADCMCNELLDKDKFVRTNKN